MGFFGAVRSARTTFWLGLALFGYYFIVSDIMRRALGADTEPVWFVFLALLLAYGLWTRSPLIALGVIGGIVFLWLLGGLARPGLSPDIDSARPLDTLYHALAPVVAVGLGVVVRAWLWRKRAAAEPTP